MDVESRRDLQLLEALEQEATITSGRWRRAWVWPWV
jgi:hypothetical protein